MECNRSSEVTPGNNMPECTAADTATTTTTTTPQTETEPIQTEVSAAVKSPNNRHRRNPGLHVEKCVRQ